jgi:hypothetical protein
MISPIFISPITPIYFTSQLIASSDLFKVETTDHFIHRFGYLLVLQVAYAAFVGMVNRFIGVKVTLLNI